MTPPDDYGSVEQSAGAAWHPVTIRMENHVRRFGLHVDPERKIAALACTFAIIGKPVSAERLRRAMAEVIDQHDALRSIFRVCASGEVQQCVLDRGAVLPALEVIACEPLAATTLTDTAAAYIQAESERPFDLTAGPLLRGQLLTNGGAAHVLTVSTDHFVADGVSMSVILRDLARAYSFVQGPCESALAERATLVRFARQQREQLAGEEGIQEVTAWAQRLPAGIPHLEIPRESQGPADNCGSRACVTLGQHRLLQMRHHVREVRASPFVLAGAALLKAARKLGASGPLTFMAPFAGRPSPDFDETVGNFSNVLPVVVADGHGGGDLISRTRDAVAWTTEHQFLPFSVIATRLGCGQALPHSGPNVFLSYMQSETPPFAGAVSVEIPALRLDALFDVSIWLDEHGDDLALEMVYRPSVLTSVTALSLLESVAAGLTGDAATQEDQAAVHGWVTSL